MSVNSKVLRVGYGGRKALLDDPTRKAFSVDPRLVCSIPSMALPCCEMFSLLAVPLSVESLSWFVAVKERSNSVAIPCSSPTFFCLLFDRFSSSSCVRCRLSEFGGCEVFGVIFECGLEYISGVDRSAISSVCLLFS